MGDQGSLQGLFQWNHGANSWLGWSQRERWDRDVERTLTKRFCWKREQRNAVVADGSAKYEGDGRIILMEKNQLGSYLPAVRTDRILSLKFFDPLFHIPIPKHFFPIDHSSSDMEPTLLHFLTTDLADIPWFQQVFLHYDPFTSSFIHSTNI